MVSVGNLPTRKALLALAFAVAGLGGSYAESSTDQSVACTTRVLEDPSGKLSFPDVSALRKFEPEKFMTKPLGDLSFGFSRSTFWVDMECSRHLDSPSKAIAVLRYALLDFVAVYLDDGTQVLKMGDQVDRRTWPLPYRNPAFHVDLQSSSRASYLISINSSGSVQFPIDLYSEREFTALVNSENLYLGLFYGILLALLCYNCFLWLTLRESSYLGYIGYLATYIPLQMAFDGKAGELFWPQSAWLNNHAIVVFLPASLFFIYWFTRTFLNTRSLLPRLDRLLAFGQYFFIFSTICGFLLPYQLTSLVGTLSAIVSSPIILTAGALAIRRKFEPAVFFTGAWVSFLVGIFLLNTKNLGLLPAEFITNHTIQIGSALEAMLLSFALGHRIKTLDRQRRVSEEQRTLLIRESEKLAVKADVAHQVAHDIRSPLSTINLVTGVATGLRDDQRELLRQATKRINNIAQDLLKQYKKSDSLDQSAPTIKSEINVARALREVVNEKLIHVLPSSSTTITIQMTSDFERVSYPLDEGIFQRVVSNLLNNSIEASGNDGRILVKGVMAKKLFVLTIEDNGCGMTEKTLEKVGYKGFTFGKGDANSGVGLYHARTFAESYGGSLSIESELSVGTKVSLILPIEVDSQLTRRPTRKSFFKRMKRDNRVKPAQELDSFPADF